MLNYYQQNRIIFCSIKRILQAMIVIKIFQVFALFPNSLIVDNNNKVINWISTGGLPEKIKPFDANLAPTMTDLPNGKVSLKLDNSVLVQKNSSSLSSNFILNLQIVYGLNNWPHNPTKNFTLKIVYFVQSN